MIGSLVDEGVHAIQQLGNVKLPTTSADWMTSVLGFQNMQGMTNVAASIDITNIYMFKSPLYLCPGTKRSCVKVVTVMDSSGKYLAFKTFKGSLTEPELFNQWDFYHRWWLRPILDCLEWGWWHHLHSTRTILLRLLAQVRVHHNGRMDVGRVHLGIVKL